MARVEASCLEARMLERYFATFRSQRLEVNGASIQTVVGGKGPPLLLLHGWPQNLLEWHRIASRLAEHFTVVLADLRGYGRSSKPASDPQHMAYSKRTMAADQIAVMRALGFERFAVVG